MTLYYFLSLYRFIGSACTVLFVRLFPLSDRRDPEYTVFGQESKVFSVIWKWNWNWNWECGQEQGPSTKRIPLSIIHNSPVPYTLQGMISLVRMTRSQCIYPKNGRSLA